MIPALNEQVKRKLNISWQDDETEARIQDIIDKAQPTMRFKLGLPDDFDFRDADQENILFLAYCFYEWNNVAPEFDKNYLNDILQVRSKWEVAACTSQEPTTTDESSSVRPRTIRLASTPR